MGLRSSFFATIRLSVDQLLHQLFRGAIKSPLPQQYREYSLSLPDKPTGTVEFLTTFRRIAETIFYFSPIRL